MITNAISTGQSTASLTEAARAGGAMGKNEFLQLLVTQLRYQDPLNPSSPEDFAAQLAQFTSVEQLIGINEKLEMQGAASAQLAQNLNSTAALSVIGKDVLAVGDVVTVPEDGPAGITFGVGGAGGSATVRILDAQGKEVASQEIGYVGAGRQDLDVTEMTSDLAPGTYRYAVEVVDESGEPVRVEEFARLRITGLRFGPDGPVLTAGELEIALADVIEISSP